MKLVAFISSFIFCCLFWNQNFAQQPSPSTSIDTLLKFEPNEVGFITTGGCKVIPLTYYCLSDGRYYFALGDKKNYYYLDSSQVLSSQNIKLGKDQRFSTKKSAGFARRLWLGTVIVCGPIGVLICGGAVFFLGYEVLSIGGDSLAQVGWLTSGLAMGSTIFYKVLKSAIQNVQEHNAYLKAQHYVCL